MVPQPHPTMHWWQWCCQPHPIIQHAAPCKCMHRQDGREREQRLHRRGWVWEWHRRAVHQSADRWRRSWNWHAMWRGRHHAHCHKPGSRIPPTYSGRNPRRRPPRCHLLCPKIQTSIWNFKLVFRSCDPFIVRVKCRMQGHWVLAHRTVCVTSNELLLKNLSCIPSFCEQATPVSNTMSPRIRIHGQ